MRSIGLDIGHTAVRAVVVEGSRRTWRLTGHASVPRRDAAGEPRPLPAVMAELDSRLALGRGALTVADSEQSLLVRYVATIPLPEDRLARLLRLELAQHASEGGELAGDTYPVPLSGDEIVHGAVLAQPGEVRALLADLARAGLEPRRIHAGAAALYNATLLSAPVTGETEFALLVDIGTATTRVALIGDDRLLAFRQLAIGGRQFTEAVATTRSLSAGEAESFKTGSPTPGPIVTALPPVAIERQISAIEDHEPIIVTDEAEVPASKPPLRAAGDDFEALLDVGLAEPGRQTMELGGAMLGPELMRVAEALTHQLASTIAWFKAQLQSDRIAPSKVLLCGGGAGLLGLESYLARRLKLTVTRFSPLAGEAGAPEPAHEYALALGLALSEHPRAVRLDLVPDAIIRRRQWQRELVWPYVAAAMLVVSAILAGWTMHDAQAVARASQLQQEAWQQRKSQLEEELAALANERNGLAEDLRAVASRIWFNRDLLYVVRVLKEQAPKNTELWITRIETLKPEASEVKTPRPVRGGAKPVSTATIERGMIELEGRVKFDRTLPPDELNRYFSDYMTAVETAVAGAGGAPLFDRQRTTVTRHWQVDEATATAAGNKKPTTTPDGDGSFPFAVRFTFLPTDLQQATQAVEATTGGG